ncbi:MAG: M3 family metallopeptidase [Chlamydiota bacterium]
MREKFCTIAIAAALGVGAKQVDTYHYPSIKTVEDVQNIYPKTVSEIEQRAQDAKKSFQLSIESFLKQKGSASKLLRLWDEMMAKFSSEMNILSSIALVEPKDDLRKSANDAYQALQEEWIRTLSDKTELYRKLSIALQKDQGKLEPYEKYYLEQLLQEMKLDGLHLPDKEREKLKTLKIELSKLSESFARNIQEDHSSITLPKEALSGLSEDVEKQLKQDDQGNKILTCDYPVYFAVMKTCVNSDTRKALYRAFTNRAYPNNEIVLKEIIAKRDQLAKLLGFKSFSQLQLSNEMVKDPQHAESFLNKLSSHSVHKGQEELAAFKTTLNNLTFTQDGKLYPWDVSYIEEKYRQARYDIDDELIRAYFPVETTIQGLIRIFEKFFDLKMETLPIQGLWHEDAKLVKITDRCSNQVYGYVIMDLFPRPNKYSHACHSTLITGLNLPNGEQTTGLSLLIANFPKSTESKPSLLTLSDVRTFFHEFGHGIHAILGRTQFSGTAGTSVKVDFVELPSQMLEEWLWDPDILTLVSSHYKTGEKLSKDIIDKILRARTSSSGCFIGRQCLLSQFALACFAPGENKDTNQLLQNIHQDMHLYYAYDKESHFPASFGHLDGYGARYYGYLWSRVFALDVFEQIKQEGLLNPVAGKRYIKEILSKGGSEDPSQMLKAYLGRDPSQKAFLKAYGIQ